MERVVRWCYRRDYQTPEWSFEAVLGMRTGLRVKGIGGYVILGGAEYCLHGSIQRPDSIKANRIGPNRVVLNLAIVIVVSGPTYLAGKTKSFKNQHIDGTGDARGNYEVIAVIIVRITFAPM
jgi:hypothetical protein